MRADGRDWDDRITFVLFAYRASPQQSTGESPFFLLYGSDPVLPTKAVLAHPPVRGAIHLDDYKTVFGQRMTEAWRVARNTIGKAQQRQKEQHDRHARPVGFMVGERVFVKMPATNSGLAHRLAQSFYGPYHITASDHNVVYVVPVDCPKASPYGSLWTMHIDVLQRWEISFGLGRVFQSLALQMMCQQRMCGPAGSENPLKLIRRGPLSHRTGDVKFYVLS